MLGGGRRRGSAGRHLAAPGAEGFLLSCLTVRHPSISIFGVKTGLLPILVAVGSTGFPTRVACGREIEREPSRKGRRSVGRVRCREVALGRDGQVIVAVPIVQHREETVAAVVSRSQRRLDRSPDCCAVSGSASASSRPFCWESHATSGPGRSRRLLRMMPTVGANSHNRGSGEASEHGRPRPAWAGGRASRCLTGGSTGRVKPSTGQTGQQYPRQAVVASTPRW